MKHFSPIQPVASTFLPFFHSLCCCTDKITFGLTFIASKLSYNPYSGHSLRYLTECVIAHDETHLKNCSTSFLERSWAKSRLRQGRKSVCNRYAMSWLSSLIKWIVYGSGRISKFTSSSILSCSTLPFSKLQIPYLILFHISQLRQPSYVCVAWLGPQFSFPWTIMSKQVTLFWTFLASLSVFTGTPPTNLKQHINLSEYLYPFVINSNALTQIFIWRWISIKCSLHSSRSLKTKWTNPFTQRMNHFPNVAKPTMS